MRDPGLRAWSGAGRRARVSGWPLASRRASSRAPVLFYLWGRYWNTGILEYEFNMTNIIVTALLIAALEGAETDHGRNITVGSYGELGILQIQEQVVQDVNRIYGTGYKHTDALNRVHARTICTVYLDYWGRHYHKRTGKRPTNEVLARIWNGGPMGWIKPATKRYWIKRVVPHLGKDHSQSHSQSHI